ncbi:MULTISPECIES: hypothetical protein [unclassified Enterococcus]|uniref:hypothetical protein n=1 Tax=unclassified Enterococcus TaxID=2608891 RepID=UPI0013ECA498|nr:MULTISPECIES: hypothetical protein [unclassified Enterococcus]
MAKLKDLEKKQQKVEQELEKAKIGLEKAKKLVKKKEEELKFLNADLISSLLVENDMTMSELTAMFSENNGRIDSKESMVQEEFVHETIITTNES